MKPMPHQIEAANKLYVLLKKYGYAYLQGQPRSGKTYTAILVGERSKANNILILTKKNAISGWKKFIDLPDVKKNYYVTNYEQASKLKPIYDFIIIDESHNIGSYPKRSLRNREIVRLSKNIPHLHLSGTAIVESPASIYHQMHISKYSPFRCKNFYEFFRKYGIPEIKWIAGRQIKVYDKTKPELLDLINKFTVYITQQDAGINIQVEDKVHYVKLLDTTKKLYNKLQRDRVINLEIFRCFKCYNIVNKDIDFDGEVLGYCDSCKTERVCEVEDYEYVADTVMKLRVALHQIEGGTLKLNDKEAIWLGNTEKIDYIKNNFDLTKKIGIMCHFKEEQNLIKYYLPEVEVYSSNAYAEGVDLSHLDYFIIYSQDYSGAKHIQRRERIANIQGSNTTEVHFLLVKNAISDQVYKATSKKMDFNNSLYEAKEI